MNMQYNHVENDISRAAAGSNALAALHPMQEFDPDDKAQFALGYGHYRNSNAGAVGAFYQPDENSCSASAFRSATAMRASTRA